MEGVGPVRSYPLLAKMEIAREEPIVQTGFFGPEVFRLALAVGLTDVPFERELSSLGVCLESLIVNVHVDAVSGGFRVRVELGIVFPHRPDDTS